MQVEPIFDRTEFGLHQPNKGGFNDPCWEVCVCVAEC